MQEKETPLGLDALAGESHKGVDDAAALPNRLGRYSRAHHRAIDMANFARLAGDVKTAGKLESCGQHLLFRDYFTVGKVRLHAANFCQKHLLCPLCAIRRGAKLVRSYLERVEVVSRAKPELRPYLVTLTVKNGESLSERFRHLHRCMAKMTQARRSYLRNKGPHVEMAKAVGGVASYEFKRGRHSELWHPHTHAVWLCYEAPDPEKLSREWHITTGDSYIVDVRPINQADPVSGFLEVFKYAVKFSDLPLLDNWEGWRTLSNRRLVFSFGDLFGVAVPNNLADESLDELPYVELLYRFWKGAGYSLVKTTSTPNPKASATHRNPRVPSSLATVET